MNPRNRVERRKRLIEKQRIKESWVGDHTLFIKNKELKT